MLKKLFVKLNVFLVLITLLSYLSPWISPEIFWPIAVLGLIYPILILLNILFIISWMLTEWKYAFYSIIVILVGWSHITNMIGNGNVNNHIKSDVTIATNNTYGFSKLKRKNKQDPSKSLKILKQQFDQLEKIDILCVQESNAYSSQLLDQALNMPYSHQYSNQGAMVYSRFPIIDKGSIRFSNETNSCVWVDLKTPIKNIRVYCLHLQSNRISNEADQIAQKPNFDEKGTWKKLRSILRNYSKYSKYRANEAKIVKKHASTSQLPVIIAGDFNDHPMSYTYRLISEGFDDSFTKRGRGLGSTYNGTIPFLRIDYILADTALSILTHDIIEQDISDHKMVISNIKIKE